VTAALQAPPTPPAERDAGRLDAEGNRWWEVEVWPLPPLYQDLYERIFAERLALWGLGGRGVVRRTPGSILYGGPDELMRRLEPAATVRRHLQAGDAAWVREAERRWRSAARAFERAADALWRALLTAEARPEDLRALLEAKVAYNAIGLDSAMPTVDEGERWLAPHVPEALRADVLDGCYLPASGHVAYDELEAESRRLARACPPGEPLPEAARARFVNRALFFLYDALDTTRKAHLLEVLPRQVAARYRRAAAGPQAQEASLAEIADRPWRRRLHRQWARQQLEQVRAPAARAQLLALHALAGSARDYDEEKRRINAKLWRALFALADGLGLSLRGPEGTAEGLCAALAARGAPALDPIFRTGG
jgi:hypothetical protein